MASEGSGSVQIGINTGRDGTVAGSAVLGFASHDGDLSDLAISGGTVTATGTLFNDATASIVAPNLVNFGIVHVGASVKGLLASPIPASADGFTEIWTRASLARPAH